MPTTSALRAADAASGAATAANKVTNRMNGGATSPKMAALPAATAAAIPVPKNGRTSGGTAERSMDSLAPALAHWPKVSQLAWSRPSSAATASERSW